MIKRKAASVRKGDAQGIMVAGNRGTSVTQLSSEYAILVSASHPDRNERETQE